MSESNLSFFLLCSCCVFFLAWFKVRMLWSPHSWYHVSEIVASINLTNLPVCCPIHLVTFIWYQIWGQIIFKREEESLASSLLNIICCQNWYLSESDYMDRACVLCNFELSVMELGTRSFSSSSMLILHFCLEGHFKALFLLLLIGYSKKKSVILMPIGQDLHCGVNPKASNLHPRI